LERRASFRGFVEGKGTRLFFLLVRVPLAIEFGDGNCGDTETDNDDIWDNSDQIDKSAKVRGT
jgi:hypothetical protein